MTQNVTLGGLGPVRESDVRTTCLHGFEEEQVLNTEGERDKEGREGIVIVGKYGQEGRMELRGKRGRDRSRGRVEHEVMQGHGDSSGEGCNISKPDNTYGALKEGKRAGG